MAEGGDGQEERRRIGMFRRAWRARWQRVRAGTPPPLVPDDSNYVRKLFWTKFNESGFPNRVNHAVASHRDKNGDWYTFSFGGYHADDDERTVRQADAQGGPTFTSAPIDVQCCDCGSRTWSCMEPPSEAQYFNMGPHCTRCRIPMRRYGHTVCSHEGRIYMYGGRNDEDGSFADVDCYDIANNIWLKIRQDGEKPMSRDGHACTSIHGEMIIHGGFSASELQFSGDTYAFHMSNHVWRKIKVKGDEVPERDFHTATAVGDGSKMIVFGGRSDKFHPYFTANDEYDDKFYCLDFTDNTWSHKPVTGYKVKGRRSHCAVSFGSTVLYFGGYNAVHKQHFGDLFVLHTDTWHVSELRPFGEGPPPRRRVGCALIGNEVLICGGTSPVVVNKDGVKREILHDHNDMYILSLVPSLEQLCLATIIKRGVALSTLPLHIQRIIEKISRKHTVTISPPSAEKF